MWCSADFIILLDDSIDKNLFKFYLVADNFSIWNNLCFELVDVLLDKVVDHADELSSLVFCISSDHNAVHAPLEVSATEAISSTIKVIVIVILMHIGLYLIDITVQ